jgi:hypothetical protein
MAATVKDGVLTFTRGHYFLFHFRAVGLVLMALGVYNLVVGSLISAVVFIALGILLFFPKEVVQIRFADKHYRESVSYFGLVLGKYQSLPWVEYVSVFPTKLSQTMGSATTALQTTASFKEIRVNLIYAKNKRLHIANFNDAEKSAAFGMMVGEQLNVGVYDCTGKENVWIQEKNVK